MINYGFATVDDLKTRLGITDTTDDVVFQDILTGVAATMERVAGRPLRRLHRITEYFRGGTRTIRTRVSPIAKIHSIRESDTRDFETSGSYEEITEGAADGNGYVFECGNEGRPAGHSGVIRRLDKNWLGDRKNPGQVQVVYTGGYKSDDELSMENSEITLCGESVIFDFHIVKALTPTPTYTIDAEDDENLKVFDSSVSACASFFRFDTTGILLPVWEFPTATLKLTVYYDSSPGTFSVYLLGVDPKLRGDAGALFEAYSSGAFVASQFTLSAAPTEYQLDLHSAEEFLETVTPILQALVQSANCIAFEVMPESPNAYFHIAAVENPSDIKPELVIAHTPAFSDDFVMPHDLRSASVIQAIHEYQTRRQPGKTSHAMRGVSIASGASWMKKPQELLPQVREVAESYRRLY